MAGHDRAALRARPTVYRGTLMRSRLEATFAANLDRYALSWQYEPCAYADATGQYLPDFEVQHDGFRWFVEVKPLPSLALNDWDEFDRQMATIDAIADRLHIVRSSIPAAVLAVASPGLGCRLWTVHDFDMGPLWDQIRPGIAEPHASFPLRIDWAAWRP